MDADAAARARLLERVLGQQPWYAVRCVFRTTEGGAWGPKDLKSGEFAYEERVTIWRASSSDEAIEKAEAEAEDYASGIEGDDTEYVGLAQSFHLFADPAEGAEVFSLYRFSSLEPDDYLNQFFDTGTERQQDQLDSE